MTGAWALLGLFFAAQAHTMSPLLLGRPLGWGKALVINLNHAALWALFTPLAFGIVDRLRWEPGLRLRAALLGLLAWMGLAAAQLFLSTCTRRLLLDEGLDLRELLAFSLRLDGHTNLLICACLLGAAAGWRALQRARARELQASLLEARLAQAQLQALKMQLHPHFLFNALNGISALIPGDPEAADEMVARLGSLLRFSLERGPEQEISLREELGFIAQYLELERLQYADRIRVEMEVPEELMNAAVPTLILQPLVENALRHGLAPKAEGGRLRLRAARRGGSLELEVLDDGYGLPEQPKPGIGTSNVRERLSRLYGEKASLELGTRAEGGARARIRLPYWELPGASA